MRLSGGAKRALRFGATAGGRGGGRAWQGEATIHPVKDHRGGRAKYRAWCRVKAGCTSVIHRTQDNAQAASAMATMLANPATNDASFACIHWGLASEEGSSSMSDT